MKRYVIFYCLASDYNDVIVDAESLKEAALIADSFSRKTGAIIVGICAEYLLKKLVS